VDRRRARQRLGFADDRGFRLFRVLALAVSLKALSFPPFLAEGLRCVPIFLQRELGSTGCRRAHRVGKVARTRSCCWRRATPSGGPLQAEGHCASGAAQWGQGAALWPIRSMEPMRRFPPELCSPGQQPMKLPICLRVKDPPQPKGLGALLRCLRPPWSRWATAMVNSKCTSSPTHRRGLPGSTVGPARGFAPGLPTKRVGVEVGSVMRGSRMYSFMVPGSGLPPEPFLNPSWPLTAAGRHGCNQRASWPPSLSLGRSAAMRTYHTMQTMNQAKLLTQTLGFTLVCGFAAGCSGIRRMDTVKDAIDRGLVSGLSASNQFSAIVWSLPRMPSGPYSKIDSLPVTVQDGSKNEESYVFFFGKSDATKSWEVFSCMKWRGNHWELVPVSLPRQEHK
jgi:hypothetical protein